MNEYEENINEYIRIGKVGAKSCDKILENLKKLKTNSETSVTLFSAFDNISLLYLNSQQLLNSKSKIFCQLSIFALSRSIIELSNTIHFFLLDKIDNDEAEFRLLMFNYMSKKDRFEIVKRMNASENDKKNWGLTQNEINNQKELIENHTIFKKLIEDLKITDLACLIDDTNKKNKYFKRHLILQSRKIKTSLTDWFYKMSSTFLHGSPAFIDSERQKYINPEFKGNDNTKHALVTMQVASSFYCATLLDVIKYFQLENEHFVKEDIKLISDYKSVIINGH